MTDTCQNSDFVAQLVFWLNKIQSISSMIYRGLSPLVYTVLRAVKLGATMGLHKFPTAAKLVQFSLEELHGIHYCQACSHSTPIQVQTSTELFLSHLHTAEQPPRVGCGPKQMNTKSNIKF